MYKEGKQERQVDHREEQVVCVLEENARVLVGHRPASDLQRSKKHILRKRNERLGTVPSGKHRLRGNNKDSLRHHGLWQKGEDPGLQSGEKGDWGTSQC